MGHVFRLITLGSLAVGLAVGCTIPPRPGMPIPPTAQVVPADTRATVYGSTIEEVVRNPAIGDKIRAMFGADWSGGQLASPGASAYFARGGPPQMVRIDGVDYTAFSGCVPSACDAGRVLLLIREGGSDIVARLDEGGFSHYYAFGNVTRDTAQLVADSGLRALRQAGTTS
jgi:hypothetical protein